MSDVGMIPKDPGGHGGLSVREYVEAIVQAMDTRIEQRLRDLDARLAERQSHNDQIHEVANNRSLERVEAINARLSARFIDTDIRYEARFRSQDATVTLAMDAINRAVQKSENSNDSRFASTNEWRSALNDTFARLMPRQEAESRISSLSEKLDTLAARSDRMEGRGAGMTQGWGIIVTIVTALVGMTILFTFMNRTNSVNNSQAIDRLQQVQPNAPR